MAQSTMACKSGSLTNAGARIQVSNEQARLLLLDRYALSVSPRRALKRADLAALIDQLGFVQIDSISTIDRAHHMILAARADGYRAPDLWKLVEKDRLLFENWTHDASLLPVQFYPFWQCRFERCRDTLLKRWHNWREGNFEARFDAVLAHIRNHGPTKARDLAPKDPRKAGGWWDWHPDKSALEFLWRTGQLAVTRREGFQKVYDLTERVIPKPHRNGPTDPQALIDWACRSALERLGYGSPADIAGFWDIVSIAEVKAWTALQNTSTVLDIEVEGVPGAQPRQVLALSEHIETQLEQASNRQPPKRLRIINPFDPLIRDRKRLSHIFGFDYRIEVFVPEAKRQYGYYVCPILEGSRMIGRIDMRHRRERGGLVVAQDLAGAWRQTGERSN